MTNIHESPRALGAQNLRRQVEEAAHRLGIRIEGRLFPPTELAGTRRGFHKKALFGMGVLFVGATGLAAIIPETAEAADGSGQSFPPNPHARPTTTRTPEPEADFHSVLNRLLNLSPDVNIDSPTGMLEVGISEDFLSSNNISGVEIPDAPMEEVRSLIQHSLRVIARSFDADSRELKLGAVNPPIDTKLRIDIVLGKPSEGVKVTRQSPMIRQNYEQIKNLLKERGVPFQEFTRLKNAVPFAESFVAFEDEDSLHLIVNGNDFPTSTNGAPEGKMAFFLANSAALLRRIAVENQSVDAWILQKTAGVTTTNGDDIYAALGCTVDNAACVNSSGGVINITTVPPPTATPRPKR